MPQLSTLVPERFSAFGFKPIPGEGAFYSEPVISERKLDSIAADRSIGSRAAFSLIHALITAGSFSALHRLRSEEIYCFHHGDPLEMIWLGPAGLQRFVLGPEHDKGMLLHLVVPAGVWQGSRVRTGGEYAVVSCTVVPAFDFSDFELGDRAQLIHAFPHHAQVIQEYTRENNV
jgi:predicted cupin superfamily sugar epimerase